MSGAPICSGIKKFARPNANGATNKKDHRGSVQREELRVRMG